MSLRSGTRLGPYEIVAPIGAGGMGEVYKATDTRLGRTVAIKILPAEFAADARLRLRFEREAKAISSLSHPNICSLFDVGDNYLVMEHCEGQTLAERLERGPLPLEKVIEYGTEIAGALDKAHRSGIVHRDLKPSNVMITPNGVKLLDFGLAKTDVAPAATTTIVKPATEDGHIVGTVPYMAPEVLAGSPAVPASDLFALGCVLYEMTAGTPAFTGRNRADLVASILERQPASLPVRRPQVPRALANLVADCLQKSPEGRPRTAGDVATRLAALKDKRRITMTVTAASLLAVAAAAIAALVFRSSQPPDQSDARPLRFSAITEQPGAETHPSLSPDGKLLVYVRNVEGTADIFLQRIGGRNAINLTPNTPGNDTEPAFSRDGQSIAFRSARGGGGIFVMGATGEAVRRIADLGFDPSWSPDGKEVVVSTEPILSPTRGGFVGELWAIDVASGRKRQITRIDEMAAVQPAWSPNGHRIVFWHSQLGYRRLMTVPAAGGEAVTLLHDPWRKVSPFWAPDGRHVYFASDRSGPMNLWRIRIDEVSGRALGPPEPVTTPARLAWPMSVAADGKTFAYCARDYRWNIERLELDARGNVVGPPRAVTDGTLLISDPSLSADGRFIAFRTDLQQQDLYVVDADGSNLRRLTDDVADDQVPDWSPDGRRIAFRSARTKYEIWSIGVDGSSLQQITDWPNKIVSRASWSPDGSYLAVHTEGTEATTCLVDLSKPLPSREPISVAPYEPGWTVWLQKWSPDGKTLRGIARTKSAPWHTRVVTYSLASRTYQTIRKGGSVWFPRWLGDSDRHVAIMNSDLLGGGRRMYLFEPDSKERVIYEVDRGFIDPRIEVSSDARFVYFVRHLSEVDIWLATP